MVSSLDFPNADLYYLLLMRLAGAFPYLYYCDCYALRLNVIRLPPDII